MYISLTIDFLHVFITFNLLYIGICCYFAFIVPAYNWFQSFQFSSSSFNVSIVLTYSFSADLAFALEDVGEPTTLPTSPFLNEGLP